MYVTYDSYLSYMQMINFILSWVNVKKKVIFLWKGLLYVSKYFIQLVLWLHHILMYLSNQLNYLLNVDSQIARDF